MSAGASSGPMILVAGETGGDIGSIREVAYAIDLGSDRSDDARPKVSCGVGSGGDIRLWISICLRSMAGRFGVEMVAVVGIEEIDDCREEEDGIGSVRVEALMGVVA